MSENHARALQGNKKLSLIKGFLEDKKAEELVILNLRGISSVTDTLVVASGHSDRHVQAVSEYLVQEMKHQGYQPLGCEGLKDGRWGLIDYGDVIVHVFYQDIRAHYDLEGVWRDAPVILDERSKG